MSGGGIAGILMIFLLVIVLFIAASCVKIVPQASAYVVESLGKYKGTWATGLHFKVPFIERVAIRVNLKEHGLLPCPVRCRAATASPFFQRQCRNVRYWTGQNMVPG